MKKNFETLEVGRRYENRKGEVVKIVKKDNHHLYPYVDEERRSYTPTGKDAFPAPTDKDLVRLLPEGPSARLAELEAKRAQLDKQIEELKKDVYAAEIKVNIPDELDFRFYLPFRKVDGHWEPAFEIVLK